MTKKLTLSVSEDVIIRAKEYAKNSDRSLSEIVESYLDKITSRKDNRTKDPEISKMRGIISIEPNTDYKEMLSDILAEKYM